MKELTVGEILNLLNGKSTTARLPKLLIDYWYMMYGREIVKDDVVSGDILDTAGCEEQL